MSNQPMPAKTPLELIQEQTELLKVISTYQKAILENQEQSLKVQLDWLKSDIEEQRKQTSQLKNISLAATIFVILVILGACIVFFNSL